jgi:hypothetical protein
MDITVEGTPPVVTADQLRVFEGRFPNSDVGETADFIDGIGMGGFTEAFGVFSRGKGWSMGLSPDAADNLGISAASNPNSAVYLRILGDGAQGGVRNMFAFQELPNNSNQQVVLGMIDSEGKYYPISGNLLISSTAEDIEFRKLTLKINMDEGKLLSEAVVLGKPDQLFQEHDLLKDRIPSVSEAQYILCMNAVEAGRHIYNDLEELKKRLPWPQSETVDLEVKQAWERIDGKDLYGLTREAIARMSISQRAEAVEFLVDNWLLLSSSASSRNDCNPLR